MKELLRNKKLWTVTAISLIFAVVVSVCVTVWWYKTQDSYEKVLFYGFPSSENYSLNYTVSEKEDLGVQTGLDAFIVAGEGEYIENNTIVRVFNSAQAKISQFSAFPVGVKGGVKVAAASVSVDGVSNNLIATAAYNGEYTGSDSVRVFDIWGNLYMEIVPYFAVRAPFNIVVGDFTGDGQDELLVLCENTDVKGRIDFALYSLIDGEKIFTGKISFGEKYEGLETVVSKNSASGEKAKITVYFSEKNVAFSCEVLADPTVKKLEISLPVDTNGVYESPYEEDGFAVTINESSSSFYRSFVKFYGASEPFGNLKEIGTYENLFFNVNNEEVLEDCEYIKEAFCRVWTSENDGLSAYREGYAYYIGPAVNDLSESEILKLKNYYEKLSKEYKNAPELLAGLQLVQFPAEDGAISDEEKTKIYNAALKEALAAGLPPAVIVSNVNSEIEKHQNLIEKNTSGKPREWYGGGTKGFAAAEIDGEKLGIVQLGSPNYRHGLLKSVAEDGSFTGDVYLLPFATKVKVENLSFGKNPRVGAISAELGNLCAGDVIEVNLRAYYNGEGDGKVKIEFYEDDVLNETFSTTFVTSETSANYKYQVVCQGDMGTVRIKVVYECDDFTKFTVNEIYGTAQRNAIPNNDYVFYTSKHMGGVSFDVFEV